jgi:hypothetical protein
MGGMEAERDEYLPLNIAMHTSFGKSREHRNDTYIKKTFFFIEQNGIEGERKMRIT